MDAGLFVIFEINIYGGGRFFFAGQVFGVIACDGFIIGAAVNGVVFSAVKFDAFGSDTF